MGKLTRIAFALLIGMTVCLAVATVVEKIQGSEFVIKHIYNSWWFIAWWALLSSVSLIVVIMRLGIKRWATIFMHGSLVLILLGALFTFLTSHKGYIHLRKGESKTFFMSESGDRKLPLPFLIRLDNFEIEYYAGTQSPADYRSVVTVTRKGETESAIISMNNVYSFEGYTFYQTSFDEDMCGTFLSVNYDPLGTPVTYAGYLLLCISILAIIFSKYSGFRRLLRSSLLKKVICLILFAGVGHIMYAAPATLSRDAARSFGQLRMLYGDRIAPVNTFARDFTVKIYGKPYYKDFDADQVLAGWIFFPEQWQFENMIEVRDDTVRKFLGSGEMASFTDFITPSRNYKLGNVMHMESNPRDKVFKAFRTVDEKVQLIKMVQSGTVFKLFPFRSVDDFFWYAPADEVLGLPHDDSLFVKGIFPLLYETVKEGDNAEIIGIINKIVSFQQKYGGNELLSESKLKAEVYYNRLNLVPVLYKINLSFGFVAFVYFIWSFIACKRKRWIERSFVVLSVFSMVLLTVLLVLRGYVAGHLPMSNGYETMMVVAWCVLLISLFFSPRFAPFTAYGLLLSGFALLVASLGLMDPQITPLMPVLRSSWLSLHVSLVMVSYALLGLVMLNGLAALVFYCIHTCDICEGKGRREYILLRKLQMTGKLLLYPAVFLLAAGIFTGAVWANISWGRYWGWDPKETWALITLIVYALPLHGESIAQFRKPLFFHIYCFISFLVVLMTYFGVNYILGGMHGYA